MVMENKLIHITMKLKWQNAYTFFFFFWIGMYNKTNMESKSGIFADFHMFNCTRNVINITVLLLNTFKYL